MVKQLISHIDTLLGEIKEKEAFLLKVKECDEELNDTQKDMNSLIVKMTESSIKEYKKTIDSFHDIIENQ